MDCIKVGKLIYSLRKEKNMTQKQVADAMGISDKTISKWERGLGCPDVSLLSELSNVLGVNVEKILLGDLKPNEVDGGNMRRIKFYVCPNCGNIINSTGEGEISCCGRKLIPLEAQKVDEAHALEIEEIEDDYYVTFDHDMTKAHYISFAAYVCSERVLIIKLYPEQSPAVRFPKMQRGTLYFYCNNDGFWKQDIRIK